MCAGLKVEEANGTVDEAAGEVGVGEGEAAADECRAVVGGDGGGVEVWDHEGVSTGAEVPGRSMPVDVLKLPRVPQSIGAAPYASGEPLPQQIRARHLSPCRTYLHAFLQQ